MFEDSCFETFNPLNVELNPIRHLLALVGARHIVHVSRIRVNLQIQFIIREKGSGENKFVISRMILTLHLVRLVTYPANVDNMASSYQC